MKMGIELIQGSLPCKTHAVQPHGAHVIVGRMRYGKGWVAKQQIVEFLLQGKTRFHASSNAQGSHQREKPVDLALWMESKFRGHRQVGLIFSAAERPVFDTDARMESK
ncbi:hypothetical protein SAMN04489740_4000 [Arthrobacter alpinus]|uniref:Uncharacterized protein n=1 Tax=Arthrobacter alpinus TaxID=656366 RepID=A0A1H5P9B9_9MICC|nr:hypothetical protein SAMN04489740_4000 [Arthrobacter alpinus]